MQLSSRSQGRRWVVPCLLLLISTCSVSAKEWHVEARALAAYGPIEGYTQIPLGGKPGTADKGRPKYSDLSIDNQDLYDIEVSAHRGDYRVYLGQQILRPSSSGRLKRDLTTRAQMYHAGERFDVDIQLDWLRLGIERTWSLTDRVDVKARAEYISFDFEYDFRGETVGVNRAIQRAGARVGVSCAYEATDRLTLTGSAGTSLPDSSLPQITVLDGIAEWRLSPNYSESDASLFAGISFEKFEYERDQTLTNHIEAELGPLGLAGLSVRF